MANKYQLRYLPLFEQGLVEIISYIANVLNDPNAADPLLIDVETAIYARLENVLSFEPYHSARERKHDYYRIYVTNYTIYYVVIDGVMEVRRFLYNASDIEKIL